MGNPADRQPDGKRFLVSYLLALGGGFLAQMIGLSSAGAGQGAVIVVFDLMLVPVAFPFVILLFLPVARRMREAGRSGPVRLALLGAVIVFLPVAVGLFLMLVRGGAGTTAQDALDAGLLALNLAVTYGGTTGVLFWRFSVRAVPDVGEAGDAGRGNPGRVIGLATAALLVWQLAFWRIALILTGGL